MNYFDLPNHLLYFIKPINYVDLLKNKAGHDWNTIPTNRFLTTDGILWFLKRSLFLKSTALIFKADKNAEHTIHIDPVPFAFNFVLSGDGEMQWLTNVVGEKIVNEHNGAKYRKYVNIHSYKVSDVWSGKLGLVRTDTVHRIVTKDTDRYCVSIRTINKPNLKTFEDAYNLVGV